MAVEEEVLASRIELLGLGEFMGLLRQAGRAAGLWGEEMDKAGRRAGIGFLAAGAVALGAAEFLHKTAEAAGEEEAAFNRASGAFRAHGQSFPTEELERFASSLEDTTGVAQEQIATFLGLLGTFGATRQQAEQLAPGILNAAEALKATGIGADQMARQIGQALQSGRLGRLGRLLGVDEAKFAVDRFGAIREALERTGGDAAATFRETLPGATQAFDNSIKRLEATIGKSIIGPLTDVTNAAASAVDWLNRIPGAGTTIARVFGVTVFAAFTLAVREAFLFHAALEAVAKGHLDAAKAADVQAAAEGNLQTKTGVGVGRGLAGRAAGIGADLAALATFFLPRPSDTDNAIVQLGKRVSENAGVGAAIGGRFGAVGAGLGGLLGGAFGAGEQIYRNLTGETARAYKKAMEEKAKEKAGGADAEAAKQTEHLANIEKNTADLNKAIGNRDIEHQLGGGRVARHLAQRIGGRHA